MPVRGFASLVTATFIFLPFFCVPTYACDFPGRVSIPDGKTATKAEMTAAARAMMKYFEQYEKYTACIESKTRKLRKSAVKSDVSTHRLREERAATKLNEASVAIEDLAERFNEATEEFEARSK
jgi:hypothetical protein